MNRYHRYPGDYGRDTGSLSLAEHGAYTVLLDHYYATETPLAADSVAIYRLCRAVSGAEKRAVDSVLERFFPANGDGRRHNSRADREIAKYVEKVGRNREVGKLGGRPSNNPEVTQKETQKVSKTKPRNNPIQNQKPKEATTSDAIASEVRGDAAPDCPIEKLVELYHELLPACPRVARLTPARTATLRARWRDEARPNREKHAGYATVEEGIAYWRRFFGWVAQSNFLTGKGPDRNGAPPFLATLSWLSKAENFAKVIEGNYHR